MSAHDSRALGQVASSNRYAWPPQRRAPDTPEDVAMRTMGVSNVNAEPLRPPRAPTAAKFGRALPDLTKTGCGCDLGAEHDFAELIGWAPDVRVVSLPPSLMYPTLHRTSSLPLSHSETMKMP
uniref:Uncharacterized protein n=1 Tax=Neobodo designis TaxID=312471 RepID=A0A7S1KXZ0_NEODS